ncbi:F0F1 ATP synthase subunit B [Domibacillus sp. DTU_2020_1001157_1_SI_ALB_TIR_016]|uniref:F0F1 ATP synthase subunit B n=1 Tax=Domibacillus sp. DTU_2020_1001157_1_SI_ALB_TIR_016 TaxID=3077789 RepID=UPI0028E47421|nr:F0F1 ATP synthase subunit B [Domibacillus sp. DTU_2020_1001157_1_SI_ALB_TIR_016]WNS81121.1 F0F1 ATP synthase subunit B [Domibacillus sp. DTU_2020_1001157_1_SI_ALB_TIR_016]
MTTNSLVLGAGGGFNTGDIFFQLIMFIILLALLKKFAWAPLMGIMQERADLISSEIDAAEKSRTEANQLLEQTRAEAKSARLEAQNTIENAKKLAEEQKADILAAARAESERLKEMAKLEIAQERDKAMSTLREQVASLSVMIASKVIEKDLSEADQEKMINDYLIKEAGEER